MSLVTAYVVLIAVLVVGSLLLRRRLDADQSREQDRRRARLDRKAEVERRARQAL